MANASSSLQDRTSGKTLVSWHCCSLSAYRETNACQISVSAAHRWSDKLPAGNTAYDPTQAVHLLRYDNRKGIATLGIKYRSIEEVTRDSLKDFKARGWL